jgi:hypothetical protein
MSNLAMYASEYNIENMNPIQKKRETMRNRTLKRREGFKSNPKIEAMVKKIHEEEEEEEDLSEFQPLGNPSSAGIERMEHGMEERMEQQQNMASSNQHDTSEDIQESFTQLPSQYAKQYYQQYVPYHNQSSDDNTPNGVNKDELLTKLNQIIYLLEEQQDEKTGHVTEELILYSFLGVFIIFVVDSFARVGKYVR